MIHFCDYKTPAQSIKWEYSVCPQQPLGGGGAQCFTMEINVPVADNKLPLVEAAGRQNFIIYLFIYAEDLELGIRKTEL